MKFFHETNIHFVEHRNRAYLISLALIVAGLVSLLVRGGPNLSIDFEGGTLVQLRFDEHVKIGEVRDAVVAAGYDGGQIQQFGSLNEYLITVERISEEGIAADRLLEALTAAHPTGNWTVVSSQEMLPDFSSGFEGGNLVIVEGDSLPGVEELRGAVRAQGVGVIELTRESDRRVAFSLPFLGVEAKAADKLKAEIQKRFPDRTIEVRRTETVGPKIGEELKNRTWAAIVISLFGILVYISWRFEFRFAVGAIVALIHDVVITVGIFSLLGKEISIVVIAAILTLVGYSLNDTIVVFDRIRENFSLRRRETFDRMVDISINESLSRTVITSLTTLFVVLCLYFLGGEVIHDFAFALLIGIVVGTYSSIYVASPILVEWQNRVTARSAARVK